MCIEATPKQREWNERKCRSFMLRGPLVLVSAAVTNVLIKVLEVVMEPASKETALAVVSVVHLVLLLLLLRLLPARRLGLW